jgi:hypothetical protein
MQNCAGIQFPVEEDVCGKKKTDHVHLLQGGGQVISQLTIFRCLQLTSLPQ